MAELVTLADAARLLGVSKATLRNWDNSGKLSASRHPINGYRLYDLEQVKRLCGYVSLLDVDIPRAAPERLDQRGIRRLVGRLHDILRDSDSQSNIITRFDAITAMIFAKAISDRDEGPRNSPFRVSGNRPHPQDVKDYYAELARSYSDIIPEKFSTIEVSDPAIRECMESLCFLDLAQSDFDVKGLAYEEILRNTFSKGDHQQFFTPQHIVDFIVNACRSFVHGDVCDPAAGTGGFLAAVARTCSDYETLTSFEIDERLSWVSGINMKVHNGRNIRTIWLPNGGTLGEGAREYFCRFDTILTNPPFGSDFSDSAALQTMHLGVGKTSRRRGILFIERCFDLLRAEGTLAIIIDEGVLNLPHAVDVRHFITENFEIRAVISLPESSFMPYASVNTSILVLKKMNSRKANHRVFYARADKVGRKPSGDDDIRYDRDGNSYLNSDLPHIAELWDGWLAGGQEPNTPTAYTADIAANLTNETNGYRVDFQYHHPSRRQAQELIRTCRYPVRRLSEICEERRETLTPSRDMPDALIAYTGLAQIESGTGLAVQELTPSNSLKSTVKKYYPGDILYAKMRPNLRKVALVEFDEPGYASSECSVLTLMSGRTGAPLMDSLLLSILLRSDFVHGQIMHLVAGIGRPRISSRELAQICIPIPPSDIQARIKAAFLEQCCSAAHVRAQAEALLEDAKELLNSATQNLTQATLNGELL